MYSDTSGCFVGLLGVVGSAAEGVTAERVAAAGDFTAACSFWEETTFISGKSLPENGRTTGYPG